MSQIQPPDFKQVLYSGYGIVVEARISRKSAVMVDGKACGNHFIIGAFRTDDSGAIVMKPGDDGRPVEDQLTVEEIMCINVTIIEDLDVEIGRFARSLGPLTRTIVNGTGMARLPYFHAHILEVTVTEAELTAAGLKWTQAVDPNHFLITVE